MAAYLLVFAGAGFCLIGAIGVLRFPDVYSRMHAAGITDTLGALLVLGQGSAVAPFIYTLF